MVKKALFILLSIYAACSVSAQSSWADIVENGKGKVIFYWFPNNIWVSSSRDILDGIELELAESFIKYESELHHVNIEIEWVQTYAFTEILQKVGTGRDGIFGASSLSITSERESYLNFTPPYIADIAVLISNAEVPVALTETEFEEFFKGKRAVTIANTTLSSSVDLLQAKYGWKVNNHYVNSTGEIFEIVEKEPDTYGYIDLPNFLIGLQKNTSIRRQFFYPVRMKGLSFIYPKNSDWSVPVNEYFSSDQFIRDKERIIEKYLGSEVSQIVERIGTSAEIGPMEEIALSHREKELQFKELLAVADREKESLRSKNVLTIIITFITLAAGAVVVSYRIKSKSHELLVENQALIEQRNQQLQAINEEKNNLIRLLAHDLRAPLNQILGISSMFKSKKILPEDVMPLNDMLMENSYKMSYLISKILDVDALESGKNNMKLERVNVQEVIASLCRHYQHASDKKQIRLIQNCDAEVWVMADRIYLEQIVENLLSNAIKFSNSDTVVELAVQCLDDEVIISVKDQGPGFRPEDESKIFKKYQTLSARPTGDESSVGLGLNIVKQYTEKMGATITFETRVGQGTTFFISMNKPKEA